MAKGSNAGLISQLVCITRFAAWDPRGSRIEFTARDKMYYLAKTQLKPSKAVLMLRHRAAPHNVLGRATRRARTEVAHELPAPP